MPPNKATIKFAQLYTLFNQRREEKYFDSVLLDQLDINFQVPSTDYLKSHKPDIIGNTALHFAVEMEKREIFERLLQQNADYTIKNRNGSTALHRAIENAADERSGWKINSKLDDSFIFPILHRHFLNSNPINPSNKYGLTHFHAACLSNNTNAVNIFLEQSSVAINHSVNMDSPIFPGYTGLHFAARFCALPVMRILLARGANVAARNAKRMTAMQMLVERNYEIVELVNSGKNDAYETIVENFETNVEMMLLLINHKTDDYDDSGLSHLHIACTMRDTSLVEDFLKQEVDVNRPVNWNSPVWPGYTPLHFAAIFNVATVKLLLAKGANLEAKDAKGITPFDLCLDKLLIENVHQVLSTRQHCSNIVLTDGKTNLLDVILAMRDMQQFNELLNNIDVDHEDRIKIRIPEDSPLWPGNTFLHLSVIFYELIKNQSRINPTITHLLDLLDECLRLGSDVTIKNAQGFTPLHLAFRCGRDEMVERMLEHYSIINDNPIDPGGLSHLHIACASNEKSAAMCILKSNDPANINLQLRTSFRWYSTLKHMFGLSRRCIVHLNAGFTPLHIAVIVGSVEIVELLLENGADLYAKDSDGLTPIHRVLTSCDRNKIGRILFQYAIRGSLRECISDKGLSHLHVASFVNSVEAARRLMDICGTNVNLSIIGESSNFSKNISIDMCDNPLTFVSSMSITREEEAGIDGELSVILDCNNPNVETLVDPYGEACKYLDRYAGFTPLHFAMRGDARDAMNLLIERGADIIAKANGMIPFYDTLNCIYNHLDVFVSILKTNDELRERVRQDTGITMLHVACHKIDFCMVEDLLNKGDTDVNAIVKADSPVWPGYTPLHVLMMRWERDLGFISAHVPVGINDIMQILLDHGADVTKKNVDLDTPLHIADRHLCGSDGDPIDSPGRICMRILLNKHVDFSVNPVNSRGSSFFHVACRTNDINLVREYLSHGVNPNEPIDLFSDERAGESPLILTAGSLAKRVTGVEQQLEVTDLLLEYGADVHAEDAFRHTPLHAAASWATHRENLLERLISHGANMYAKNIFGDTAFERLLRSFRTTTEEIEVFLNHGFSVNSFNEITEEGYMSMLFSRRLDNVVQMTLFEAMVKSTNVAKIDEKGRTAIHNIVSNMHPVIEDDDFVDLIEKLTEFGLDIDAQDVTGKTALHTASKFQNHKAVSGLLKSGADLDILDATNWPAFACLATPITNADEEEIMKELTIKAFVFHLQKLLQCGLQFSQMNAMIRDYAIEKYGFEIYFNPSFCGELDKAKNTKIGSRSLTLYDFLSETGAVAAFPTMAQLDRDAAKEFFECTCKFSLHREFHQLVGLFKLQHKKAWKRLQLVEPAKLALLRLIPCMLPDLCSEAILRFFSNAELIKLISVAQLVTCSQKSTRVQ